MRLILPAFALGLVALPSVVQAGEANAPSAAAVKTVQQLFDEADAANAAKEYSRAVDLLTQLESRVASNPRSRAIIRVRKATALVELARLDEARLLLGQALPVIPRDDDSLAGDRMAGAVALGRIAAADLDYDESARYYARALEDAKEARDRVAILLGQAQATTFSDPARALVIADEAVSMSAAQPAEFGKRWIAAIDVVRGRALLNLGRFAEAEKVFARAIAGQGGLTMKVDYDDLVARSDASIAAMLAGHRDAARNYLAYTGAGRLEKQDFTKGADMGLPPCGLDGVQPDDYAVVEFGIGDNGAVTYARPVYGSRPGSLALTFARAVARWSWRPEDVVNIPGLFRMATRLELRCSTAEGGPSVIARANAALGQWLESKGVDLPEPAGGSESARRDSLVATVDRLRASGQDGPPMIAALVALLSSPMTGRQDVERHGQALRRLIDAANLPPLPMLAADEALHGAAQRANLKIVPGSPFEHRADRYHADPEAMATFRILDYDAMRPREKARAQPLLDAVIDDKALAADAPIKVAALIRRASARAAVSDLEGARRDFATTGLSAQQCAIVDARPSLRAAPTSSADYPTDMLAVGVEGWTRIQFDIAADGSTRNQRAVITYPPMTFGPNGQKVLARARFEQSYRPDGGLGCGGGATVINFRR